MSLMRAHFCHLIISAVSSVYVYIGMYIVDVLWGQPIKLIQLMPTNVQNFMNIDGTTLILIIWSPWVSGGPQKPQILTASTKFYAIH